MISKDVSKVPQKVDNQKVESFKIDKTSKVVTPNDLSINSDKLDIQYVLN